MKRFTGEIYWIKLDKKSGIPHLESRAHIKRAILNENIFKIDHKNPDPIPESEIRLRSKDGFRFEGSAKYVDSLKSSAVVDFDYYFNGEKAILMGNWVEDKIEFMCIVRLIEVDSFKD